MILIFPLCVLLVYVVLAAQYESWSLPLGVILIVPMTLLSAIAGVWLTGGDNNVFTQISFLVLAALACKNAILIVEFARQRENEGESRRAGHSRRLPRPAAAGADDVGGLHHGRRRRWCSRPAPAPRSARRWASRCSPACSASRSFGLFLTPVFYVMVGRRRGAVVASIAARGAGPRRRRGGELIMRTPVHRRWCCPLSCRDAACGRPYEAPAPSPRRHERTRIPRCSSRSRTTRGGGVSSTTRCWSSWKTTALRANHDVRVAVARVDQARAVFDDVELDRLPTVIAGGSVDRREQAVPGFTDEPIRTTTYRAGFDAFWEIDLFGGVRSAVQRRPPTPRASRRRSRTCA